MQRATELWTSSGKAVRILDLALVGGKWSLHNLATVPLVEDWVGLRAVLITMKRKIPTLAGNPNQADSPIT
jgi:hypothetical protein